MAVNTGEAKNKDGGQLPRTVKVMYTGAKGETWLPGVETTEDNKADVIGGQLRMRRNIPVDVPVDLAAGLLRRSDMKAAG